MNRSKELMIQKIINNVFYGFMLFSCGLAAGYAWCFMATRG